MSLPWSTARIEWTREEFERRVTKDASGCWLWQGFKDDRGYALYTCHGKKKRASRLAMALFGDGIPDHLDALHRCDNPPCVNPAHLFAGTHADNMRDCKQKGRQVYPRGLHNGRAKLSDADVAAIAVLHRQGVGVREIGRRFGVGHNTVRYRLGLTGARG